MSGLFAVELSLGGCLSLVVVGLAAGFVAFTWLQSWSSAAIKKPLPKAPPASREQVLAKVMLHRNRRRRQLAELERYVSEQAEERLHRLDAEDWSGQER